MKNFIFRAFYQGKDQESLGAGNCASVAIIKAAIHTYRFNIFDYTKNDKKYIIELKNKEKIELTEDELNFASKASSFILGKAKNADEHKSFKELLDYAHLCFAVICKMAQKHGDFSSRFSKFIIPESFELAVEIINDGTLTPEVYEFLGLEEFVTPTYRMKIKRRLKNGRGMVIWTKTHAMFATNGYFDLYGKKVKFKRRIMARLPGKIAFGIFQLKE